MRFVVRTQPGHIELNYMWLPTFIGMNEHLIREIEGRLGPHLKDQTLDDDLLNRAHNLVVDYVSRKFQHVAGLREYLDDIANVKDDAGNGQTTA